MTPTTFRCEHSDTPLAVATRTPRFSWHNEAAGRGARQTAYQIIVSEKLESIRGGAGTLWDTGKVLSEEQHAVPYAGAPLASFSAYFWRARSWDEAGRVGPYGAVARFETGAFEPADWSAEWITRTSLEGESAGVLKVSEAINKKEDLASRHVWALYFAKAFRAEGRVRRARAYASGLGYYELAINGRKVGDRLLDPGQTDYRSGALYSALAVEEYLAEGDNVVILSLANGRHIDAYGYPNPRGMVQLLVEYDDGRRQTVVTDRSWLFSYGPIHENGIYLGERYDARDEAKLEALAAAALGELSAPARGPKAPGKGGSALPRAERAEPVPLRPQLMPPIRATRELRAAALASPAPGEFVYDFGQNFAGVVRLSVRGPRGAKVLLRYAELVGPTGDLHLGTNREAPARDEYILRGEGTELFQPRFTYHGFRYVKVSGYPGTPTIESVRAVVLHTDAEQTGSFVCSDPLINRIHENTLWSQRANLMSIPTDCPQRGERMGWLGDAQLASEQAMYNFDMAAFYVKYLDDIRLSQREDGSLSDVTPAYWPLYPADPAWGTAYVTLAWALFYTYGDRRILEEHFDAMKRYVDFLERQSEGDIIRGLGKYGDWCPPGSIFPKQTPIELTSTWYYYHDTLLFSRIAEALGRKSDAAAYRKRSERIKQAFNREFLKEEGRYATLPMSPIDRTPGQTSQVLPLFLDLVPEKQRKAAAEKLVSVITDKFDSHVDTGIVGTRYLFDVLRREGHAELAYRMITQRSYPGWGYMIACGATTIWERWEELRGLGMNSHNHIMLGSVDAWFYRALAGIAQTAPAWRKTAIAPCFPASLTRAAASVGTLYGEVSVSWRREGGAIELELSVPVGVEATLRMPCGAGRSELLERGKRLLSAGRSPAGAARAAGKGVEGKPPARKAPGGILAASEADGDFVVTVGSGRYEFTRKG